MTPIISGKTNVIPIDYKLDLNEEIFGVSFPDPISVEGAIRDSAGYTELLIKAHIPFLTKCARCLNQIQRTISLDFKRVLVAENNAVNKENDDYIIINDNMADIDTPLAEEILLEFPSRFLCNEECRGLCPKCGVDLNTESCSCVLKEPDMRFKVLLDYLELHPEDEKDQDKNK